MGIIREFLSRIWISLNKLDLGLMVLGLGVGIAVIKYLDYSLEWAYYYFIVIWIVLFTMGSEFYKFRFNAENRELLLGNDTGVKALQLLALLFFSLSLIPFSQIIHLSPGNYFVIYLLSITGSWIVLRESIKKSILVYGLNELLTSFMISSLIPLLVIAIQFIKIPKVLFPISFFNLLIVFSSKLINKFLENDRKDPHFNRSSFYIGLYSIRKIILILISSGYIFSFFIIYYLKLASVLYLPLLISIPLTTYIFVKVNKINSSEGVISINEVVNVLVIIGHLLWLIILWRN